MKPDELIAGMLAGDQHQGGIRCLRLFGVARPFFASLRADVERYRKVNKPSEIGDMNHVTHWTNPHGTAQQFSLLNRTGCSGDFSTDHDLSCRNKWFFDCHKYPILSQLIGDWPHLVNFRINVLHPGASLDAHEEHVPFRTSTGTIGARLRFHLPLLTNDNAELILDGQVYRLPAGEVHLINQGCVHSADNRGESPRVHLVWDALLTKRLFRLISSTCPAPDYLIALGAVAPRAVATRSIGPYRRLAPAVSRAEAATMNLCLPQ
ncbi:MAG: aspartyl/asparaginyl beta-hydroxylase domain-containing protein [Nitrococcus mobilis]|nr:aspartyl/asparaginyl beta-hydroxylase domain-containing protein [Nitrococcus mobilis]